MFVSGGMGTYLTLIIGVALSYLVGSFPTAFVAGRWLKGIDIRQHGSGNVGTTNAFRVLGKGPGAAVFFIDVLKGIIPTVFISRLVDTAFPALWVYLLLGFTAVVGHNWTVFLEFKGGKGIATSLGVLVGLSIKVPGLVVVLLSCVGLWAVVFLMSGYVSLASLCTAVFLPVIIWLTQQSPEILVLGLIFCAFIFVRHRTNISRLITGTESRTKLFSRPVRKS